MKICGYCGSQLDDSAIACSFCGRVLVAGGDPEAAREQALQNSRREAESSSARDSSAMTDGPGWQREQTASGEADVGQGAPETPWGSVAGPQSGEKPGGWDQQWSGQGPQSGWDQQQWGGQDPQNGWNQQQWGSQDPQNGWNQQQWGSQGPQSDWNQQQWGGQSQSGRGRQWNGGVPQNVQPQSRVCGFAIASLVTGIVGIFFGAFYCVPCIVAIVLGIVAIVKIRQDRSLRGKGMAIAGLVLGVVFTIIWTAMLVFTMRLISGFIESGGDVTNYQALYEYLMRYFGMGVTFFL